MPILLLLNNWGAWQVAKWLRGRGEDIVGLVLQPPDNRRFADEILSALDLPPDKVWTSNQLSDPDTFAKLRELRPDIGISAFFGCILKPEAIQMFPNGCIPSITSTPASTPATSSPSGGSPRTNRHRWLTPRKNNPGSG